MAICPCAVADEPTTRPAPASAPAVSARDLTARAADTGVYVDDSFEGAQAMADASRLVAARRYEEAAQRAQAVIDDFGRKVGRDPESGTFVSLARLMERQMLDWPSEALAAYQSPSNSRNGII